MVGLRAQVVRWVSDEPFPGLVEVRFTDAEGRRWSLVDKAPIFAGDGELGPDSAFPVAIGVACVIRGDGEPSGDDGLVTVSTSPHGVESVDGRNEFTVRSDQLIR